MIKVYILKRGNCDGGSLEHTEEEFGTINVWGGFGNQQVKRD